MTKLIVGDMHCREKTILPAIDDMIAERDDINGIVILGDTQDAYGATTADRVSVWHLDTMDSDRTVLLAHDDGAMEVKRLSGVEQLERVGA